MEGHDRDQISGRVGDTNQRQQEGEAVYCLTRTELQRMIAEASRQAVIEYERTATLLAREPVRRQLFEDRGKAIMEEHREVASRTEPEKGRSHARSNARSNVRTNGRSEMGSSKGSQGGGRREPAFSRAEVEAVSKQIERLGQQIDEMKKKGEMVAQNRNSPFTNKILTQTVGGNFRLPDLPKYDGTKDPQEHVLGFELVMNLYGQPDPINAKLFVTTLTGKAQEWFTSLPSGTIESYEQLVQKFVFHFASKKKAKRSATYLFTIRQKEDESLKDFIGRFNNEMLAGGPGLAHRYDDQHPDTWTEEGPTCISTGSRSS